MSMYSSPALSSTEKFILALMRQRFWHAQTVVSWLHQRWVWHTETLKENSYVVFYDELKVGGCIAMFLFVCFSR